MATIAAMTVRPVLAAAAPKPSSKQAKTMTKSGFSAAVAPTTVRMTTSVRPSAVRQQMAVSAAYAPKNFKWGSHQVDEYPSPDWVEFCREEFKNGGEGMATLEEARTLFSQEIGYRILDVRSPHEQSLTGEVKQLKDGKSIRGDTQVVQIPLFTVKKSFDQNTREMSLEQAKNPTFQEQVSKAFPDKAQGVVIMCSDSINRSVQTAIMMDSAGYTNLVIMQWGFNGWTNKFSNKILRRRSDGYKEDYSGEGTDSAGIHSSGAGFARMDGIDKIQIKDSVEWMDY